MGIGFVRGELRAEQPVAVQEARRRLRFVQFFQGQRVVPDHAVPGREPQGRVRVHERLTGETLVHRQDRELEVGVCMIDRRWQCGVQQRLRVVQPPLPLPPIDQCEQGMVVATGRGCQRALALRSFIHNARTQCLRSTY